MNNLDFSCCYCSLGHISYASGVKIENLSQNQEKSHGSVDSRKAVYYLVLTTVRNAVFGWVFLCCNNVSWQ